MKNLSPNSKIYIAGHRGLVGSAIVRNLEKRGFHNIIKKTRADLDLRSQTAVQQFFNSEKPEFVVLAAAKVGGIQANNVYRGDFIRENLEIQNNVIGAAFDAGTEKLVFLGSSCIYPKLAPQPMPETALLTGPLEPTNDAYAVAKIAGLMMCKSLNLQYKRRFISVMPTNVYGPNDRYDLENSHVLPALIRKFHEAKIQKKPTMTAWGSGSPKREFIHSDDLAEAIVHCLEHYEDAETINIGTGQEVSIRELTHVVADAVGFAGKIEWDSSKPDGMPRKLLDSAKLFAQGWKAKIPLATGIKSTYLDYVKNLS